MTSPNADDTYNEFDARYLLREAWRSWTPTVTQSGSVTVTITYARYIVLARLVVVQARLAVTGTGTAANAIIIGGVPSVIEPANSGAATYVIGAGLVRNTGTAFNGGVLAAVGVSDWRFIQAGNNNFVGIAPSFALASGDEIGFEASYER